MILFTNLYENYTIASSNRFLMSVKVRKRCSNQMIEYKKFYNVRQWEFFHYRYSQYLHTKEQSDTFRVWRLIILLKSAKCVIPARVNSQLLTRKSLSCTYIMWDVYAVQWTLYIKHIYFVHSIYIHVYDEI